MTRKLEVCKRSIKPEPSNVDCWGIRKTFHGLSRTNNLERVPPYPCHPLPRLIGIHTVLGSWLGMSESCSSAAYCLQSCSSAVHRLITPAMSELFYCRLLRRDLYIRAVKRLISTGIIEDLWAHETHHRIDGPSLNRGRRKFYLFCI